MSSLINGNFFQFSPERFKNPLVIVGIIIAVIAMILLFTLEKIIFKLMENKKIKAYLDIDTQEDMDQRVKDVTYRSKMIGKGISLVLMLIGFILCMLGVK